MSRFRPEKLHVRWLCDAAAWPRRYTLTHSDRTGDLFLTIGADYDHNQVRGWYTRIMRDEVLAEWREQDGVASLHVHVHVSGGFVIGTARWRDAILRRELPLVLQVLRFADSELLVALPQLEQARISVHFNARRGQLKRREDWGCPADYRQTVTT